MVIPSPLGLLRKLTTHHTGDSAIGSDTGPGSDLHTLRREMADWLRVLFGEAFKDRGATLAIGKQKDGYSCGPCVLNAIEHAILEAPLFTHESSHSLRAAYFVRLMGYLLKDVSALSLNPSQTSGGSQTPPPASGAVPNADGTSTSGSGHTSRSRG